MRVAIVTGAAQGIGRAIALRLAADGLAVGVNDLSSSLEGLNGLVDEITSHGGKALAVPADISKEPEVIEMVKTVCDAFGGLDVVRIYKLLVSSLESEPSYADGSQCGNQSTGDDAA
ncbi:hypothetical protein RhiTH_007650 [Rhizoctonia solani]